VIKTATKSNDPEVVELPLAILAPYLKGIDLSIESLMVSRITIPVSEITKDSDPWIASWATAKSALSMKSKLGCKCVPGSGCEQERRLIVAACSTLSQPPSIS